MLKKCSICSVKIWNFINKNWNINFDVFFQQVWEPAQVVRNNNNFSHHLSASLVLKVTSYHWKITTFYHLLLKWFRLVIFEIHYVHSKSKQIIIIIIIITYDSIYEFFFMGHGYQSVLTAVCGVLGFVCIMTCSVVIRFALKRREQATKRYIN